MFAEVEDDCNDEDENIYPGAEEICSDDIDNYCNDEIDEDGCTTLASE